MKMRTTIWRDASLMLRILGIDARAFFPLIVWLYHPRLWTFILAGVAIFGFFLMEKKGYTLFVLLRALRHRLRGPIVYGRAWWHYKR